MLGGASTRPCRPINETITYRTISYPLLRQPGGVFVSHKVAEHVFSCKHIFYRAASTKGLKPPRDRARSADLHSVYLLTSDAFFSLLFVLFIHESGPHFFNSAFSTLTFPFCLNRLFRFVLRYICAKSFSNDDFSKLQQNSF